MDCPFGANASSSPSTDRDSRTNAGNSAGFAARMPAANAIRYAFKAVARSSARSAAATTSVTSATSGGDGSAGGGDFSTRFFGRALTGCRFTAFTGTAGAFFGGIYGLLPGATHE